MKFSTVLAIMGTADALTLNQMAEIYKQVYQRPVNDLFMSLDVQDNTTANATSLANSSSNATANVTSFAQDNATANATGFANSTGNITANVTSFA
jgi:hypothetical protein